MYQISVGWSHCTLGRESAVCSSVSCHAMEDQPRTLTNTTSTNQFEGTKKPRQVAQFSHHCSSHNRNEGFQKACPGFPCFRIKVKEKMNCQTKVKKVKSKSKDQRTLIKTKIQRANSTTHHPTPNSKFICRAQ